MLTEENPRVLTHFEESILLYTELHSVQDAEVRRCRKKITAHICRRLRRRVVGDVRMPFSLPKMRELDVATAKGGHSK
jgi:hypothetical protein